MLTEQGSRPDWTPWSLADPYDPTGIFCLLNVSLKNRPKGEACRLCHTNEFSLVILFLP